MTAKFLAIVWLALSLSSHAPAQENEQRARDLCNTGAVYYERGEYARAGDLLTRAVAAWEVAGKTSDDQYASTLNNLAAVYRTEGRYAEAEKLYQRALAIHQQNSDTSAESANVLHNLALLYFETGRYTQAEAAGRRALTLRQALPGDRQGAVAQSMNLLGVILQGSGRMSEAVRLYGEALALTESLPAKTAGRSKAETLTSLAAVSRLSGDYGAAGKYLASAVGLLQESAGDPALFAKALNEQGLLARAQGDGNRAEQMFGRALAIWRKTSGPDQPEYASGLANMGLIYQDRHQLAKARSLYFEALQIHEARLGPNSLQTGNDLIDLGQLLYQMHQEGEAKKFFEKAIAGEKARGGAATSVTGLAEACLGMIAARHKKFAAAEDLLRSSVEILTETTAADDPRLIPILEELATRLRTSGDFGQAEEADVKAMRIRVRNAILLNEQ